MIHAPFQGLLCLDGVGRLHNDAIRQRTKKGNVAQTLVRLARTGWNESRIMTDIYDLGVLGGIIVNLFIGTRRQEYAK